MTTNDNPLPITQRATVIDAFAYGMTGADIHAFDSEWPLPGTARRMVLRP